MTKKDIRDDLKKPDEFIGLFGKIYQKATPHRRSVTVAFVAILLILAGLAGWKLHQDSRNRAAADAYASLLDEFPLEGMEAARSTAQKISWADAVTKLEKFLKDYGNTSFAGVARLYRGRALLHQAKYEDAVKAFSQAENSLSDSYRYLAEEGRGFALMQLGRWPEAIAVWTSLAAAEDNPLRPVHTWNLGLSQENAKKTAEAIQTYQGFEKDFPSSPLLENVRARLADLKKGS